MPRPPELEYPDPKRSSHPREVLLRQVLRNRPLVPRSDTLLLLPTGETTFAYHPLSLISLHICRQQSKTQPRRKLVASSEDDWLEGCY